MSRLPASLLSLALGLAALAAARGAGVSTESGSTYVPPGTPLTLEQSVAQALAKNFAVQIQLYSLDQAKAGVIIARSAYDPVFGVSWSKTVALSPAATTSSDVGVGGAPPYVNTQGGSASVTQPVITGGTVTAGYGLGRDDSNIQNLLNPAYVGDTSLTISQPLLQAAGIDYNRALIQRAQLGQKIADLDFKSSVLTTILNVETAYFNLIFARQQYRVALDTVKLAQELLDENTIKRKTGVLTTLDVVQAQAGVATARSQLIGYKQTMENAEDMLLQALGEREFKNPVGPVDFPPLPDTNVNFDVSYKLARDNGPSLALIEATIQQYKLDALRAKRNNLPQLNATGGIGYLSAEHSYPEAANNLWPGSGYNWTAGLALSFPWGMRNNRALYRQAMDNVNSEEVALDQTDQTLVVNLRNAIRSVQSGVEAAEAAAATSTLSQKQYELQKAKFDAGLATSYDVLQAQNLLETARVTEIQARVGLRVSLSNLRFLEGTSLETYRISLKE